MSSYVAIGRVIIGGASHCTGLFSGQNMQNNWDSHAPSIGSLGAILGNYCLQSAGLSAVSVSAAIGQPIIDADVKANGSPMWIGP